MIRRAHLVSGLLLLGSACTKYEPRPLAPENSAAAWASRSLSDTALARVTGRASPDSAWTVTELVQAAWYYRPELEAARGAWRTAQAAEITAGMRPQPGVAAVGEYADAGPVESPWGVALTLTIPIELGGKRGARLAAARARTLQAELETRTVAWNLASDVRTAALSSMQSDSTVDAWRKRVELSNRLMQQVERLFDAGSVTRATLEQATVNARLTTREWRSAQGTAVAARSSVARHVGVPVPAMRDVRFTGDGERGCAWTDELTLEDLRAMALRRRYEMGSALAAYAVREGELRIAVANQYPDLQLTPGWAWDQGLNRWILGLALPQLLLNRNKGPIAEAVARRAMEGSNVEAVQQLILAEVDAALADCAASRATLDAAAALMEALHVRERSVRAAFDRGEVTQFEGLSLALALAEAEAELQRATLTRIVLGSQLSRVTGLWSRSTSDSLADPLSWPAASAIVARSDQ